MRIILTACCKCHSHSVRIAYTDYQQVSRSPFLSLLNTPFFVKKMLFSQPTFLGLVYGLVLAPGSSPGSRCIEHARTSRLPSIRPYLDGGHQWR